MIRVGKSKENKLVVFKDKQPVRSNEVPKVDVDATSEFEHQVEVELYSVPMAIVPCRKLKRSFSENL